jgi:hypothetical protein
MGNPFELSFRGPWSYDGLLLDTMTVRRTAAEFCSPRTPRGIELRFRWVPISTRGPSDENNLNQQPRQSHYG